MEARKITIGRADIVDLPDMHLFQIKAKIDTGAYTSALHCSKIKLIEDEGIKKIYFELPGSMIRTFETENFREKIIKNSFGHIQKRYIIRTTIVLFNKRIKAFFSLSNRKNMRYPILIGRKLLKNKFIVDVSQLNLSFESKKLS